MTRNEAYDAATDVNLIIDKLVEQHDPEAEENNISYFIFTRTIRTSLDILDHIVQQAARRRS